MKVVARLLPAVLAVLIVVVGGMELVSHAQSNGTGSSLAPGTTSTTLAVAVTKAAFVTAANQVCLTMAQQLEANYQSFQQDVKAASQTTPINQGDAASIPLDGTTTTLPGSAVPSGTGSTSASTSTTTSPTIPSGSYDLAPIQANPLQVVNQLLNTYMDQLDAVVGMQNDTLDELETLSEPPGDEPVLQQMWVSLTQATIAQNQADVVLENIVSDYYSAGYLSTRSALNGGTLSLGQAEQNEVTAGALNEDLLELTGGQPTSTAATGSLESNLQAIAGPVDSALAAYGLNECEIAGIEFQNFQTLAASIPDIANDYLTTYTSQASSGQPISLAQILASLPAPVSQNLLFSGGSASG